MNLLKRLSGQGQLVSSISGPSAEGCCFLPNGDIIAVSFAGGEIRLIDITLSAVTKTLDGKVSEPGRIAVTMDGLRLAVIDCARGGGGGGKKVEVWDVDSGKCILATELGHKSTSIALSPDGTILAVGRRWDTIIDLYDISTGQLIRTLNGHGTTLVKSPLFQGSGTVQDLAFLDGRFLVSGADDGQGILWNIETGKGYVVTKHDYIVYQVCVSHSGKTLVTGGSESWLAEGRPNLFGVVEVEAEGTEIKTHLNLFGIKAKKPVKALAFTLDDMRILVAARDDTLWLWSGKVDAKPIKHNFGKILALSQDATKIAAESNEALAIWDIGYLVK